MKNSFQGFHLFVFRGVSYHGIVKLDYGCNLSHQRNILEKAFAFLYGFGLYLSHRILYSDTTASNNPSYPIKERLQMGKWRIYTRSIVSALGTSVSDTSSLWEYVCHATSLHGSGKCLFHQRMKLWRFTRLILSSTFEFHSHVPEVPVSPFLRFPSVLHGVNSFIIQLFHLS